MNPKLYIYSHFNHLNPRTAIARVQKQFIQIAFAVHLSAVISAERYRSDSGALKSAVLHFVFFVMLKNKIEQSAKRNSLLKKPTDRTFENRWSRYKELGKKVPQAYRVYVEDTFLPCDAGDARIFSKEETGLYYYGARYLDPKYSRWLSGDPALGEYVPSPGTEPNKLAGMGGVYNTINLHVYHYAGNNPVKYVDPDGEASILMRQIDAGLNAKYDSGHVLGKYFDFAKHSLIDYGTLKSFRDSGGLIHQLGKKLGIVNREVTKNDQYIIKYTNMDDDITKQAVENVLGMERFGGRLEDGKHNNDSAKQKYKILINDCNAFTRAVFKEYKKLWKENWKKENKSTSRYQAWKAWRKHYKEISARRNEEIQIKH